MQQFMIRDTYGHEKLGVMGLRKNLSTSYLGTQNNMQK